MEAEGIVFKTNSNIGVNVTASELIAENDAVLLAIGSICPRDLQLPGKELMLNRFFIRE